jgi:hypothetical protein
VTTVSWARADGLAAGRASRRNLSRFLIAHAFPRGARGHLPHPPPAGLIGLTCKEVQHLFAALLTRPDDKPPDHQDNDLRLQY